MSLNPLNELKRKLDDGNIPLPKRLCLAKNLIQSHHFPAAPKERIVAEWLQSLTKKNKLSGDDLKSVIGWFNVTEDGTNELKSKLIQIVAQYLKRNPLQNSDIQYLLAFLENTKLIYHFSLHIEDSLLIAVSLLQFLKCEETPQNIVLSQRIFTTIIKFYKESKKKLEFIGKLLDGENFETVLSYLDTDRHTVVKFCETVLFPMNKKSFFATFLQTLVRKDNIQELMAEKGDNIQSVLKIMDTFFKFPSGRTTTNSDEKFLCDFIDLFVCCYKQESQLIFAFYVMIANCLNMEQFYVTPAMTMNHITFGENSDKMKRNIFLSMLQIVHKHEVDINVRLSDTLGVKLAKVETKKTFLLFLEAVMMGQLKTEGKPDRATFEILQTALTLDPSLVEPKLKKIVANLMVSKKSNSAFESYTKMLNCLIETLFKLSRGTVLLDEILPFIKNSLEASNTVQQEKRKLNTSCQETEKFNKSKIISFTDIFPEETIDIYGKLTSELMFRQYKELLASLQNNFEQLALNSFSAGDCSPSTLTLLEIMAAILSSFFRFCKMADHTVPTPVAEEFWIAFQNFENEHLKKFGDSIILNIDNNRQLLTPFLKLCLSLSQLKLLNIKYGNTKLPVPTSISSGVFDLSFLLPCLTDEKWNYLVSKMDDDEAILLLDEILIIKTIAVNILTMRDSELNTEAAMHVKNHIIKQLSDMPHLLDGNKYIAGVLLADLEKKQAKEICKTIVKHVLLSSNTDILKNDAICNHWSVLSALLVETVRNILRCFENADVLTKAASKSDFSFANFAKDNNMKDYFTNLALIEGNEDQLTNCVEILKHLKIYYLEETHKLTAIFVLLAVKNNCPKRLRRNVDHVLQSIFELSPQSPDLYKLFPVDFIFSFKGTGLLDLLTLKIKTSNNYIVLKSLVESAVKRVKIESDLVKSVVDLLLAKQSKINPTSIEFFNDPAFQISCIILPLIVKQKKVITLSAYRSILADLQEKLHKSLLNCFKNINFNTINPLNVNNSSADDSVVVSEGTLATLNAISAYSITLSRYCEPNDAEENKNLDYLWTGLDYFVQNALQSLQNPESEHHHVDSSIQLLNSVLRYMKKLESHQLFQTKDKLFFDIWKNVKARLSLVLDGNVKKKHPNNTCLDDIGVTIRFLCEWVSVDGFNAHFVVDLGNSADLQAPTKLLKNETQPKSVLPSNRVTKFLWVHILKANIVGPKCVALTKIMYQNSRNLQSYIHQNYEIDQSEVVIRHKKKKMSVEYHVEREEDVDLKLIKMDDATCDMLKINIEMLLEVILAAKKINLDYKFLDSIFELQQSLQFILGHNTLRTRCEVSWQSFFKLFNGSVSILNNLLMSREELLEDRWPCYMQCYRELVSCLCDKSSGQAQLELGVEQRLGQLAHSVEKLTQSICKRKAHVSRIAAYTVGDVCSCLERSAPSRDVRQHLENSIALLIQASDTAHAMAFLRRALAGSIGQITMTNMYTMFKRYHKYVGNS